MKPVLKKTLKIVAALVAIPIVIVVLLAGGQIRGINVRIMNI